MPDSGCCWNSWLVEAEKGGVVGCKMEVVAEEGSTEDVPRELGVRSGREV